MGAYRKFRDVRILVILRQECVHLAQSPLQVTVRALQGGHPQQTTMPLLHADVRLSCQFNVSELDP